MKVAFLISILLSLVAFVRCYAGTGFDPLEKILEAQRSRKFSANYVTEAVETEYLPVYVGPQGGLKEVDKITTLSGQPNGVNLDQYSGYVTVDPKAGRALFYYFVESQNSSSKPLVLWLNGGPGCSSFGNGAMMELGPFRVNSDGKTLSENKYAWNNAANILFLESPAGVGFSYSNTTSDYDLSGDKKTAADSYTFLVNWLERFPEYKTRDFFITGESYAGHYVPQLAQLILQNNKITNQTVINLKGIAIGNAYVDYETEYTGMYDYFWTHALISDEIHEGIVLNCNFSSETDSDACISYTDQAMQARENIFFYDIYAPLCSSSSNSPSLSAFDPCSDTYIHSYLNTPEVQRSLHANVTGLPGTWESCNNYIGGSWNDAPFTVLPTIQELMGSGISVWIYSGDTDARVPVTTSRYDINKLKTSVETPWYPWYTQGEVGGYAVGYKNLTFVTIRGAGHFVPSYQPVRALAFFSSFLDGKLPPSNQNVAGYQVVYDGLTFATVGGAGHEVPRFQPRGESWINALIKQHLYITAPMKVIFLLSLLLSLVAFVQCYAGTGFDPLETILEAQRSRNFSSNYVVTEGTETVYSPVYVGPQDGLKEVDKITTLPGQPNGVNLDQYSGYVTVDPNAGRALFYYFVESQNSSTKPLVLWLNGGPGCSSFGNGAMMELGPFRVNSDGKTLSVNKYAWNNAANILFLESPAGVGFSYSNTSSDYDLSGDIRTAADSYTFLVNWLERFPEYKTRDFFITGESYAGHYVPQLAQLILQNNKITNQTVINLKGIAIGNAYIDHETQNTGMYDYFWTHALISDEIHEGIVLNCNFSNDANISDACIDYLRQAYQALGNIFLYDIYAPLCSSSSKAPSISAFDPCSDTYIYSYLNTPEVQRSLHANVTGLPGPWDSCNRSIGLSWNDKPLTVLPTIQELMGSGISVWIYSGDTDGRVPVTTSRYGINKLETSVETPWYPWSNQGEVGGYAVGYKNLTFVTIRGAGHFVPSYQPARALAFFSSFLDGKLPPSDQNWIIS
ncbi:uncharacterized protein LOC132295763 [Cornus florida]|uniref:uncharacterized protein LOC132295763 n=1 Tax=Cornus florida TaxID=4283 RepID=UPI0028A1B449|nr:uncharacterized protein LOC132295763 [Cornus florida]